MTIVDANVLLRYLLNDVPDQAQRASSYIEGGASTTIEVVAEVVYVLQGVYEVPREKVAQTLSDLFVRMHCERHDVLLAALDAYRETSLDFVDCILLATSRLGKAEVLTFDKKLARAIEATHSSGAKKPSPANQSSKDSHKTDTTIPQA